MINRNGWVARKSYVCFSFWIIVCALHSTAFASDPLSDQWMGIYSKQGKIGYGHLWVTEREGGGYLVSSDTRIKLSDFLQEANVEPGVQETRVVEEVELDAQLRPIRFQSVMTLSGREQTVLGTVQEGALKYQVNAGGYTVSKEIPFSEQAVLSSSLDFILFQKDLLKVGESIQLDLFVEALQMKIPVEIKVLENKEVPWEGEAVDVLVVQKKMMNMISTSWVTEKGVTLREDSMEGFTALLEPKEKATDLGDSLVSMGSFLASSVIKISEPLENPRERDQLKVRLINTIAAGSGTHEEDSLMEDSRQKILHQESSQGEEGFQHEWILSIKKEGKEGEDQTHNIPITEERFAPYLLETPMIQSNHPEIRKKAKEVVDGEESAFLAAAKINQWVFGYLEKKIVDNLSALDAFQSGEGECQSHTALFAAMSRAVGIPTRMVSGLVYANEFGGFLFHAWPEVYTGSWVAMDPSFGQNIADATHIKLTVGGWKEQLKLLNFIGKIKIEVME